MLRGLRGLSGSGLQTAESYYSCSTPSGNRAGRKEGTENPGIRLLAACSKANPDHATQDVIFSELIRETGDVAEIELRPEKHILGYINLNAGPGMKLEMIRASHRRGVVLTDNGADTGSLIDRKTGSGAADSSHQLYYGALSIDRSIYAVKIIKRLPVLQGPIIIFGWLETDVEPEAEMLPGQYISSKAEEKTMQARIPVAVRLQAGRTGLKCVYRIEIENAGFIGFDLIRSETDTESGGAFCSRKRNAEKQKKRNQEKVTAIAYHVHNLLLHKGKQMVLSHHCHGSYWCRGAVFLRIMFPTILSDFQEESK
jgi:hypothetical protein